MGEATDSKLKEVKRLAAAGDMRSAVILYREIYECGTKDAVDQIRGLIGLPPLPEPVGSVPLSPETVRRVEILFRPADHTHVVKLLIEKCGNNLPDHHNEGDPQCFERIRFAALKWSNGDLSRLHQAINLAKVDWRDLLVAAGFADNTRAHKSWEPVRTN